MSRDGSLRDAAAATRIMILVTRKSSRPKTSAEFASARSSASTTSSRFYWLGNSLTTSAVSHLISQIPFASRFSICIPASRHYAMVATERNFGGARDRTRASG